MNPIINIICRTHNRRDYFKVCYDSIKAQTYPNYVIIVGSDVPCDYYPFVIPLKTVDESTTIPPGHYYAPWNRHLETLAKSAVPGFITYCDDDDKYCTPNALGYISKAIQTEDDLILWRVQISPGWIVPSDVNFGKRIVAGDCSGIGFAFHTKHLPIEWGCVSYGDYRVLTQLVNKGLTLRWIDMVLTQTINGAHNGKS